MPHEKDNFKSLIASGDRIEELKAEATNLESIDLKERQLCDIELLLNGGFTPLKGFLTKNDYEIVLEDMRLTDGTLWPMPINLDVPEKTAGKLKKGQRLALRDPEGVLLAIMTIEDKWKADKKKEAQKVYATTEKEHPGVEYLYTNVGEYYLGGEIEGVQLPLHYDYKEDRHTPAELASEFAELGWKKIVGFQTRNPVHKAHIEMMMRASREADANILLHPVVGMTKPGDLNHYIRVHCYKEAVKKFPIGMVKLSLLPLAMRMAGPREALWHAIIRKNYGCTHFIVGRDHAGVKNNNNGNGYYGPYEAQTLVSDYQDEIGIEMIPFKEMVYLKDKDEYMPVDEVKDRTQILTLSGTEFRDRLIKGIDIPSWFSYPEVVKELRKSHPPRDKQGFTVFFTGLPSSGKSTLANVLMVKLMELNERPVTLLDGDIVRKNLSSELGFSREHRDLNVLRIGFVANEITKNRGIAICAPIAPYEHIRAENRRLISQNGGYIEVHVSTPIEVCEKRDRKGLYAKARKGLIKEFTGIDDPYEVPKKPQIRLDTSKMTPEEGVNEILLYLENNGYIK